MGIILDILGSIILLIFATLMIFLLMWLLMMLIYKLNRPKVFRTASAIAAKLNMNSIPHDLDRDLLEFAGVMDNIPIFLFAHARYDGVDDRNFPRVLLYPVSVILFVAIFPQPLSVSFKMGAGRQVEANASSGDLFFDNDYKIITSDPEGVKTLLASEELKHSLRNLMGTGILPLIDDRSVTIQFSIYNQEKILKSVIKAVNLAEMMNGR